MGKYDSLLIGIGMFFATISVSLLVGMGLAYMSYESVNPFAPIMVLGTIVGVWVIGFILTQSIIAEHKNKRSKKGRLQ